jgi:hypothetical protein
MRAAMGVLLHIVMLPHLLTNADHVVLWPIYIRIAMFWLHITAGASRDLSQCQNAYLSVTPDRTQEQEDLAVYLPDLSLEHARGWMDIIYLCCMIVLLPCLDHRNYTEGSTPEDELTEADAVCTKYAEWRLWLGTNYVCCDSTGERLDWEVDIFSVCIFLLYAPKTHPFLQPCLLNMALTLWDYNARVADSGPTADIFDDFTVTAFRTKLRASLKASGVYGVLIYQRSPDQRRAMMYQSL